MLRDGKVLGERDSVVFKEPQYSYPLIAALTYSIQKSKQIKVYDIGGSLGSTFYQHKHFFGNSVQTWNIIEQRKFVNLGNSNYKNGILSFQEDLPTSIEGNNSFFLLSSTLQYLEKPNSILKKISELNPKYIFIDKTPFSSDSNNYLTVQNVNEPIYKATYPAWHFSEQYLLNSIPNYKVYFKFDTDHSVINQIKHSTSVYKGYFLIREST